jgi:Uma2 family endonuclease
MDNALLLQELEEPRYENYGDGPVAMAGGSTNHGAVIVNLRFLLKRYLSGNVCALYPSDVQVVFADGKYVYPDLSVVCSQSRVDAYQINGAPDLVVEVLSPSTAYYDRKKKLPLYFENGAKEVWLVSCEEFSVYVYTALGEFMIYHDFNPRELEMLSAAQKAELVFDHVKSPLFPEFKPLLKDVFEGLREARGL